jgi:PAS domain S-box-containing protein
MKRIHFLIALVIIIILAVNLFLYFDTYKQQIEFQKNFLINQTQICSYEIETTVDNFQSELNYILFSENLPLFFSNADIQQSATKKFELLYTKYQDLVVNIMLYDSHRNVFSLFRDSKKNVITDNFVSQIQKEIQPREVIETIEGSTYDFLPIFKDNTVVGNVQVGINYESFIANIFEKYHVENIQWQWLIDEEGRLVMNNVAKKELTIPKLEDITDNLAEGFMGDLQHSVNIDGKEQEVISVYIPTRILNREYGVVFSLQTNYIKNTIIKNSVLIALITLFLIGCIILIFGMVIRKKGKEEKILKDSEESLKVVLDKLPIGILMLGSDKKIRRINKTAIDLFGVNAESDLIGKDIADKFLLGKKLHSQDSLSAPFDPNQFIYYEKDGNELVIYKKQIPLRLKEEDIFLEAFIDITPIEKARKHEAAANQAKSDFLARMSHEIRSPLHGIIGLTEALDEKNIPEEQKEFTRSIRKSADLMLSIIDDLMDLSKIEAGKMMLEEIPFQLRDEINISVNLFRSKADKKGLKLTSEIDPTVPDHLIGDPFRLRQVISNLLDNAVKFTHKGEIHLGIEPAECKEENITLKFVVEDTGIGIPIERHQDLFVSAARSDGLRDRGMSGTGLGITISKQLVEMMNGHIWVESPGYLSKNPEYPGSRFCFTIEVYSNEKLEKNVERDSIRKYHQIKTLIIQEKNQDADTLLKTMQGFGISTYVNCFQENTIELLRNNVNQQLEKYKLIIIRDTPTLDGFQIAYRLFEEKLSREYILLLISSNDRSGNYIRARRFLVDHYVIEPYQSSEIFNIIQDNFPHIVAEPGETTESMETKKDIAILVADDNLINQKVAQAIFKNLGYEIDLAVNGREVIEKVKLKSYDIIFMDLMMPEMDGMEAADEIRKMGLHIPIIAVTADTNQEARIRSQNTSMNDYIAKPVKGDEIKRVLIEFFSKSKQ